MEIILNNMSYYKSKSDNKYCLKEANIQFKEGNIYGIINFDLKVLYELFIIQNRPSSGIIKINNVIISKDNKVEVKKIVNDISYVGDYSRDFSEKTVKEFFLGEDIYLANNKIANEKFKKVLLMVLLKENYLDRNPNTLSLGEKKRIILAKAILNNPSVLIIDNFCYELNHKEKEYFQKLFLKFKTKYNKTLIINENLEFLFNIVDRVFVLNNGQVVIDSDKKVFYDDKLYDYVDIPKIVEFTKYVLDRGININSYIDLKELIKEIYRNLRYH